MIEKLRKNKVWVIVGVVLIVNIMLAAGLMLPGIMGYTQADDSLLKAQVMLQSTQQARGQDIPVLQLQVERASTTVAEQVQQFLSEDQIEDILNLIYTYAEQTNVIIASMQSEPIDEQSETNYIRTFKLQVEGSASDLMNFIIHFKESTLPSVQISRPGIIAQADSHLLNMDVNLYVSQLAPGNALAALPTLVIPQAVALFPTEPPPTATPLPALPPDYETAVMQQPEICGDAPQPLFSVGETVVVDFNVDTSLRILAEPRVDGGDAEILANVQDNAVLKLIGSPVCGIWEGKSVWYWQVEYGSVIGWAGEAISSDRWMCSIEEPECG